MDLQREIVKKKLEATIAAINAAVLCKKQMWYTEAEDCKRIQDHLISQLYEELFWANIVGYKVDYKKDEYTEEFSLLSVDERPKEEHTKILEKYLESAS